MKYLLSFLLQRDAGDEDDRDSGSLSILATLKEGDQV